MGKNYLLGVILLITFTCAFGQWAITNRDLATILGGVSFISEDEGWVSGAGNGIGPVIFYTNNGGLNWTQQNTQFDTLAFLAIAVNDQLNGISSGLGIVGLASGSAYTTDGQNWNTSKTNTYVAAFQSVGVAAESETWQVGTWAPGEGNGMLTSTDYGATDNKINWPLAAEARYGCFPDGNLETAFIAGGDFPDTSNLFEVPEDHYLFLYKHNLGLAFNEKTKAYKFLHPKYPTISSKNIRKEAAPPPPVTPQWWAAAASTSDGGQTWTTLINDTWFTPDQGYYFNQISFTDDQNGWIVGQGQTSNGTSFGNIFNTNDGGSTWTVQLNVPNGELTAIQMTSPTTGWAAGGVFPASGHGPFEGIFWQTTDGQTWNPVGGSLKDYMALSISIAGDVVYAVGVNEAGFSSVAKYTPPSQ